MANNNGVHVPGDGDVPPMEGAQQPQVVKCGACSTKTKAKCGPKCKFRNYFAPGSSDEYEELRFYSNPSLLKMLKSSRTDQEIQMTKTCLVTHARRLLYDPLHGFVLKLEEANKTIKELEAEIKQLREAKDTSTNKLSSLYEKVCELQQAQLNKQHQQGRGDLVGDLDQNLLDGTLLDGLNIEEGAGNLGGGAGNLGGGAGDLGGGAGDLGGGAGNLGGWAGDLGDGAGNLGGGAGDLGGGAGNLGGWAGDLGGGAGNLGGWTGDLGGEAGNLGGGAGDFGGGAGNLGGWAGDLGGGAGNLGGEAGDLGDGAGNLGGGTGAIGGWGAGGRW